MVKMAYIIGGAVLVVALAVIGAIAYYQGDIPGLSANTPFSNKTSSESNGTVTALQALSVADKDVNVKNWKDDNKNVSIGQISSDFCTCGLSDTWTITYASDTGEASAHVENGTMRGMTATKTPERLYPVHNTPVNRLIDSTAAFDVAARTGIDASDASVNTMAPASTTLAFKASGSPIWDINYQMDGGNYIIRIDASSGSVIESAALWR